VVWAAGSVIALGQVEWGGSAAGPGLMVLGRPHNTTRPSCQSGRKVFTRCSEYGVQPRKKKTQGAGSVQSVWLPLGCGILTIRIGNILKLFVSIFKHSETRRQPPAAVLKRLFRRISRSHRDLRL